MQYNFLPFKTKLKEAEEWLKKEFQGIRTSRATPALLDGVKVEAYGSMMGLKEVGSISVADARSLLVSPWDASLVKGIEKAIAAANLGVSVGSDERGVRVSFPELTAERRDSLVKLAKERLEQARKTIRGERDTVWHDIQEKERSGELSEDEKFRFKDEMEKLTTDATKRLEALLDRKEEEIRT